MDAEPRYNKPEKPGIWMAFDNTVDIYHVVKAADTFEIAARDIFNLLREAQTRFPDWPRVFYLDIIGHRNAEGRFEEEFVELQQEFLIAFLGPFFTALDLPLVSVFNPEKQRNDVPDRLNIAPPVSGGSRQ